MRFYRRLTLMERKWRFPLYVGIIAILVVTAFTIRHKCDEWEQLGKQFEKEHADYYKRSHRLQEVKDYNISTFEFNKRWLMLLEGLEIRLNDPMFNRQIEESVIDVKFESGLDAIYVITHLNPHSSCIFVPDRLNIGGVMPRLDPQSTDNANALWHRQYERMNKIRGDLFYEQDSKKKEELERQLDNAVALMDLASSVSRNQEMDRLNIKEATGLNDVDAQAYLDFLKRWNFQFPDYLRYVRERVKFWRQVSVWMQYATVPFCFLLILLVAGAFDGGYKRFLHYQLEVNNLDDEETYKSVHALFRRRWLSGKNIKALSVRIARACSELKRERLRLLKKVELQPAEKKEQSPRRRRSSKHTHKRRKTPPPETQVAQREDQASLRQTQIAHLEEKAVKQRLREVDKRAPLEMQVLACTHELEGLDQLPIELFMILAEVIRPLKRHLNRVAWQVFVKDFDPSDTEDLYKLLLLVKDGKFDEVSSMLIDPPKKLEQVKVENEVEPLLKNLSVAIVGGPEKMTTHYVAELNKLGAKSVDHYSGKSTAKLEAAEADVWLFIWRRCSHTMWDIVVQKRGKLFFIDMMGKKTFLKCVITALKNQ